jgi:capsular exopolysaccharide synthesis family protein
MTLLKALRRRWLLALTLGTLCAAGAAAAAWFLLAPLFTVASQIYVNANPEPFGLRDNRQPGHGDFSTFLRLQAARIKNREVLLNALKEKEIQRLDLVKQQPEPILWLESELKVEFQEGSEIIKVSMNGTEPLELVALVKAVSDAYLKITTKDEIEQRTARHEKLKKFYAEIQQTVLNKKESLRREITGPIPVEAASALPGQETGPGELLAQDPGEAALSNSPAPLRKEIMVARLSKVHEQGTQVRAELNKAERKLAVHKERGKELDRLLVPEDALKDAVEADAQVKLLDADRDRLQKRIDRSRMRPDEGLLIDWRRELSAVEGKLKAKRDELRSGLEERYRRDFRARHEEKLAQLQEDFDALIEQEKSLGKEFVRLAKKAREIGTTSTVVDTLLTEIGREENALWKVGDGLKALELEMRQPPRIMLYQEAAIQKKDIKRQLLATIMAPVMALGLVGIGIGWWEFRARRIHSTDEVIKGLGLSVVGAMPALPDAANGRFLTRGQEENPSEHQFLESIDGLRTVLLRDASVTEARVIMVTSARGGEGKTTLAGHLACSLARAGRRTLLVDCDLRQPTAHQMFEQTLQPGFSEVLLKEVDVAAAVRPTTAVESLWLLPAGEWDREVLHALAQDGTPQLFQELRKEFDFIVVDSSPVLAATDSLLVGQHVDAVILSLLRDVSQVPPVQAAAQRLTRLGIRVLGAVVNGLDLDVMYGSGYKYGRATRRSVTAEQR